MKKTRQYVWLFLLCLGMTASPVAIGSEIGEPQRNGGGHHRTSTEKRASGERATSSRSSGTRTIGGNRSGGNRNNNTNHNNNTNRNDNRNDNRNNNRNNNGNRPGGNQGRPNGGNNNRPNNNGRPNGGKDNRPNNGRPNNGNYRPNDNHGKHHGGNPGKPKDNHGRPPKADHGHGGSAPRPGGRPSVAPPPPHHHDYRPPHHPRPERPLPPPPPRPPRYGYGYHGPLPTISGILGLTFGSLIDYGITTLIDAGYAVTSAIDNAIFLTNVSQCGIVWPEATVYYTTSGMNCVRFQYGSTVNTDYRYRATYAQLCQMYGNPISVTQSGGSLTATWWGGNNTGYITLQYGPSVNNYGGYGYYTDLIYGM